MFWSSRLKTHVFEKHLNSFSCISFMKLLGLSCFLYNLLRFFKNSNFQNFNRSNVFFNRSKIPWFLIIVLGLTRLVLYRCSVDRNWKIFKFLSFSPNFFHASFMFRIHMYYIVFCIHLAILQSYLSLFSHIHTLC